MWLDRQHKSCLFGAVLVALALPVQAARVDVQVSASNHNLSRILVTPQLGKTLKRGEYLSSGRNCIVEVAKVLPNLAILSLRHCANKKPFRISKNIVTLETNAPRPKAIKWARRSSRAVVFQ